MIKPKTSKTRPKTKPKTVGQGLEGKTDGQEIAGKALQAVSVTKSPKPNYHPHSKTKTIIKAKQEHPDLTTREIAKMVDCDHSNVVRTLQRYGIDQQATEDFKARRADVFAGLQERILKSITDEAIQKTPAIQLVTAASILYDKERLERGESTSNVSVLVGAIKELQQARQGQDINDD
jgi:hypothetical protein